MRVRDERWREQRNAGGGVSPSFIRFRFEMSHLTFDWSTCWLDSLCCYHSVLGSGTWEGGGTWKTLPLCLVRGPLTNDVTNFNWFFLLSSSSILNRPPLPKTTMATNRSMRPRWISSTSPSLPGPRRWRFWWATGSLLLCRSSATCSFAGWSVQRPSCKQRPTFSSFR